MQIKPKKLLPCRQVKTDLRLRIHHPEIAAAHIDKEIPIAVVVPGRESDGGIPALVEDVISDMRISRGSPAFYTGLPERHRLFIESGSPAKSDQIVGDVQMIRPLSVDAIAVYGIVFHQLVPAGRTVLGWDFGWIKSPLDVPDDIVINQIYPIACTLDEDRLALFPPVQKQISGDPVILIAAVEPDTVRTEGVKKHIPPDQSVHAVMKFDGASLPGKLHLLPAGSLKEAVLHQHVTREQPRETADTGMQNPAPAHHAVSGETTRLMFMVPALIPNIHADAAGPVHRAILDNPVMSAKGGKRSSLRNRRSCRRMQESKPLHADIGKKRLRRCKTLFPHRNLDFVVLWIRIPRQTEVNLHAICLHPVRTIPFAHLIVQSDLPQRHAVTEDTSSPLEKRRHIRLVIFKKETVVQDVHHAKRVVATKQVRIKVILIDTHLRRLCTDKGIGRKSPPGALPKAFYLLRCPDLDLSVSERFITDHMPGVRPAALRMDPFPIHAGMNPDSVAGLCQRGCLLNPRKRMCCCSVRAVLRCLRIHDPLPLPLRFLLPEIKF